MTGNIDFAGTLGRRRFLARLAGAGGVIAGAPLLAACGLLPGPGTQPPRFYRLGYLGSTETLAVPRLMAGLAEHGYIDGQNLTIDVRGTNDENQRREYAAELVSLKLDCIVTGGSTNLRAVMEATRGTTIPVVGANFVDPVAAGWATSLARPGGNFTGVTGDIAALDQKRMGLFKEAVSSLTRVGVLWTPTALDRAADAARFEGFEEAGRAVGVEVLSVEASQASDLGPALEGAIAAGIDGLYVAQGGLFNNNRPPIFDFASEHRLPAIYGASEFADAGGLLAVSFDTPALHHRAATLVDKVLRGASPGEIPIELATGIDLVLNLQTARALGLTFPQSILIQATAVIQ